MNGPEGATQIWDSKGNKKKVTWILKSGSGLYFFKSNTDFNMVLWTDLNHSR